VRDFLLSVLAGNGDPKWPDSCGAPQDKDFHEEYVWSGSVEHSCALQRKSKTQLYLKSQVCNFIFVIKTDYVDIGY